MEGDPTNGTSTATDGSETPESGGAGYEAANNPFPWEAAFGPLDARTASSVTDPSTPDGGSAQPSADVSKPAGADGAAPQTAAGAPAETPSKPEATAGEQPADTSAPSRRQAARERDASDAEKAELRALVDQAMADRDAARAEADRLAADQAARDEAERQRAAAYTEKIGDNAEFNRRQRISNLSRDPYYTGERLSTEEEEEFARWASTRELRQPFMDDADQSARSYVTEQLDGQRRTWVTQALTVADEIGLPRAELAKPENANLATLLRITDANAVARVRAAEVAPLQERISQLEAHVGGQNVKLAHSQRVPPTGGVSDGGLDPGASQGWDPGLSWDQNFGRTGAPAS